MTRVRCPRCFKIVIPVDVHGHEQCPVCHLSLSDCCSGLENEPISPKMTPPPSKTER